ncbi:MAG: penicillin acylase family protein, partial [Candidatus Eisenbacteria bacterium]
MSPWRPAVRGPLGLMIALAILAVCLATLDRPPRWTLPAEPAHAPSLAGRHASPRNPVRIVTDRWGIPHLRATRLDDLYFAWGYVTARDRLWQLEYSRRAARGELWQWLGNAKLRDDGGAQLFELATRAHRIWERERLRPEVEMPLRRYADGVNAYLAESRRGAHRWPRELLFLGRTADEWQPEDTFLVLLAQGMVLDFDLPELDEADEIAKHGRAWEDARHRFEDALAYH